MSAPGEGSQSSLERKRGWGAARQLDRHSEKREEKKDFADPPCWGKKGRIRKIRIRKAYSLSTLGVAKRLKRKGEAAPPAPVRLSFHQKIRSSGRRGRGGPARLLVGIDRKVACRIQEKKKQKKEEADRRAQEHRVHPTVALKEG